MTGIVAQPTRKIVVKVGTSTLTAGSRQLSSRRMLELVRQIAHLHDHGHPVILVTSGAMTAGREKLGFPELHPSLPVKQMLASVGQAVLMQRYGELFNLFNINVSQVLLTRGDINNRTGYLNARDTLLTLLDHRILPIINENDTIATEEIRVGDNDNLSALVANLIDAELLILLTDIEGLYTADPRYHPDARLIQTVPQIDESIYALAGGTNSGLGTGGMITKIQAAHLAGRSGTTTVIAPGARPDVIAAVVRGDAIGTTFLPPITHIESRKRWLTSQKPQGSVHIDEGAVRGLVQNGASLLPIGVIGVDGEFERGEPVRVCTQTGAKPLAIGLSNYNAIEARALIRTQSAAILEKLGYTWGDELIHRDNLVLL
jgi:glutamate 5-kinase